MNNNNNYRNTKKNGRKIVTACIGQCVHVAGVYNFLNIAEQLNFQCEFLGPATPISRIINEIKRIKPEIVGLSYRLTPTTVLPLLERFKNQYKKLEKKPKRIFFAGTPEVVKIARKHKIFDELFTGGETRYDIVSVLKEEINTFSNKPNIPMNLIERIQWKKPYPIIRAHFGLSNFEETIKGIKSLAESKVLDVVSIAPDQNTQANYFHPEEQVKELSGAGGVPLRSQEDFIQLHKARLCGNFPLLRIYAGTRDFIKLAKLYQNTIKNAWAAIPIFWFNQMDGRGPLTLKESIKQHLKAIKWHAKKDIPVEINDSHHWSLRDAPDVISVADMYLSGIIAKNLGVKYFIAQYMFNTPPGSTLEMDLAKILAKNELLNTLVSKDFKIIKQVRTGLSSFPLQLNKAKGQLAVATAIQLAIKPDVVHVVSFSEANHAARPEDIIESCDIVEQVINRVYSSNINYIDEKVEKRKEELITQTKLMIDLIPHLAKTPSEQVNPWTDYKVLNRIIKNGIFDAPHLMKNHFALGKIKTKMIEGACYSWDEKRNKKLDEVERIKNIIEKISYKFPKLSIKDKISKKAVMEK